MAGATGEASTLLVRRWPEAFAFASFCITVLCASAVLRDMSRRAGWSIGWGEALLWQGLLYGSWAPFAWAAARIVRRLGLSGRMLRRLYVLTLLAAAAHAVLALWLQAVFTGVPIDWRSLEERGPIDLLIATALAAVAAAVRAQRLAAQAARRAAALTEALETARVASAAEFAPMEQASRLLVATGNRRTRVEPGEIEWFSAAGNYVVVNWAGREGLMRGTLNGLSARLDPAVFARAHRSTIVNLAKVKDAASLADGSWRLTLHSGAELVVSRTYRDAVLRRLRGDPNGT